jgi:hypothetical protein
MSTNSSVQAPSLNLAPASSSQIISTTHPPSNIRRIARMERQRTRVASLPSQRPLMILPDTLDSHSHTDRYTDKPLKRNLSQAFLKARSGSSQGVFKSHPSLAEVSRDPVPAAARLTFSQLLISHLPNTRPADDALRAISVPPIRTALTASQALRGTLYPAKHVGNGTAKDYSKNTWTCHCCTIDFPNMQLCTEHLRDHHGVESDVVTLTPDRDVITMVMASAKFEDKGDRWRDGDDEDEDGEDDEDEEMT